MSSAHGVLPRNDACDIAEPKTLGPCEKHSVTLANKWFFEKYIFLLTKSIFGIYYISHYVVHEINLWKGKP
jgi:hypothetical protein